MSVLKSQRNESKLTVIVKAKELTVFILKVTRNEKHFPKRSRWQLSNRLVNAVLDITQLVDEANALRVDDDATKESRHIKQEEAYAKSEWFLDLLDIALRTEPVASTTVEFATKLTYEFQRLLRAWQRSDKERCGNAEQ